VKPLSDFSALKSFRTNAHFLKSYAELAMNQLYGFHYQRSVYSL